VFYIVVKKIPMSGYKTVYLTCFLFPGKRGKDGAVLKDCYPHLNPSRERTWLAVTKYTSSKSKRCG